jgi:tetratricopeptide (TPR) repeat protein
MFKSTKIAFVLSLLLIFVSCGNDDNIVPYADILSQQPFAPLSDSIKNDKKNEELYFRRAVLLNANNLEAPALLDFKKAWSLKKDERFAIAISTLLIGSHPDSALVFLGEALTVLPGSLLLQLNRAHAYETMKKIDQALAVCDNILSRYPQEVDVLKLKAELFEQKGKKAEALASLEKAYQITPYDIELNYILALKYAENKNSKVLILCDSLIKVDSLDTHAEPNYYRGIYFSNLGEKQKAINEFNQALEKDYYFLDGYIEKAAAQYDLKQYPEAIRTLELSLTISPKFADGYYWMGKCLEALGDKEQANLNYQKAYGLDKELEEAKKGMERTEGR